METQVTGPGASFHGGAGGGGASEQQQDGNASPSTIPSTFPNGKDSSVGGGIAPMETTPVEPTASAGTQMTSASRSPSASPVPSSSGTDLRSFPPGSSTLSQAYGSKVTLEDEQTSSTHRPNHGSASNLLASPMSCPPHITSGATWSAPNSTTNTPTTVPTVIHTGEIDPSSAAEGSGPTPYFPAMPSSSTTTSKSTGSSAGAGKTVQVTAKKKHQVKLKASTSSTSLHSADGVSVVSSSGGTGGTASATTGGGGGSDITARRQKRLERNRESARLSRRRRKQYLEVLEDKVNQLSLDVDQGRRTHARLAISTISQLRSQALQDAVGGDDTMGTAAGTDEQTAAAALDRLDGSLSRSSKELLALSAFWTQQLKSFSLAPHTKGVLWLTLQGDAFFRGGRAASERLSAARIGERMLNSGNDKVPPISSMWPLVCNEVGLSYDQEERLRSYQRSVLLPDESTWLHRHTARASGLAVQSAHDGLASVANTVAQRDESFKPVLTPQQRIIFLSWAEKNAGRINARFENKRRQVASTLYQASPQADSQDSGKEFCLIKHQHLACNLYILNHQLQTSVVNKFPYRGLEMTSAVLKKLSRRASFESLGQQKDAEGKLLKRDDSFASSGSLSIMNSPSTPSLTGMEEQGAASQAVQFTPEEAEKKSQETVEQVLGPIKSIIPPISPPVAQEYVVVNASMSDAQPVQVRSSAQPMDHYHHGYETLPDPAQYPAPTPVLSISSDTMTQVQTAPAAAAAPHVTQPHYHSAAVPAPVQGQVLVAQPSQITYSHQYQQPHPGQQYIQQPQQQTQILYTTQAVVQPAQMVVVQAPSVAPPAPQAAPAPPPPTATHVRKSSFLPPHLNVVPEDMFPTTGDVAEDDFFVGLMEDDDWAIGGGMDLSAD